MRLFSLQAVKNGMKQEMTASLLKQLPAAAAAAMLLAAPAWSQDQGDGQTANESPTAEEEQAQTEAGAGQPAPGVDAASAGETAAGGEGPAAEGAEAEGGPAVVLDEEEESVLDDQTFEGDDEDFIPTEEIPVDEPIPFPTDI